MNLNFRSIYRAFLLLHGIILLGSCSSNRHSSTGSPQTQTIIGYYEYQDGQGNYRLDRETIVYKGLLLQNDVIYKSSKSKFLEKSQTISRVSKKRSSVRKTIGRKLVPKTSEFKIWINNEEYRVRADADFLKRRLTYDVSGLPTQIEYEKELVIPNGDRFCFFSTLPSCLKVAKIPRKLLAGNGQGLDLWIIWENYPFNRFTYSNFKLRPITRARIVFEGKKGSFYNFTLETEGQTIALQFNKFIEFERMYWISQGIAMKLE